MATPKSELAKKFQEVLGEAYGNPHAVALWFQVCAVVQHFDDIYDGDVELEPESHMECADVALVQIPSNLFYQQYSGELLPVIRSALQAWEHATLIEEQARGTTAIESHLLRHSFELRNALFDLALYIMQILHGREGRRTLAYRFMEISRDYEDYPTYVKKVTAAERPAKRDD